MNVSAIARQKKRRIANGRAAREEEEKNAKKKTRMLSLAKNDISVYFQRRVNQHTRMRRHRWRQLFVILYIYIPTNSFFLLTKNLSKMTMKILWSNQFVFFFLVVTTTIDASRILYLPLPTIHFPPHQQKQPLKTPTVEETPKKPTSDEFIPASALEQEEIESKNRCSSSLLLLFSSY